MQLSNFAIKRSLLQFILPILHIDNSVTQFTYNLSSYIQTDVLYTSY